MGSRRGGQLARGFQLVAYAITSASRLERRRERQES
jgi:hypothetical protein